MASVSAVCSRDPVVLHDVLPRCSYGSDCAYGDAIYRGTIWPTWLFFQLSSTEILGICEAVELSHATGDPRWRHGSDPSLCGVCEMAPCPVSLLTTKRPVSAAQLRRSAAKSYAFPSLRDNPNRKSRPSSMFYRIHCPCGISLRRDRLCAAGRQVEAFCQHIDNLLADLQRCCGRRGRYVADMDHPFAMDEMKIVHQVALAVHRLGPHPRAALNQVRFH